MSGTTIDRSQRRAAGYACLTLFSLCNTLHYGLTQVANSHPPSGVGMGDGLTPKEKDYVHKLALDFHAKGEILRKLGRRFLGR